MNAQRILIRLAFAVVLIAPGHTSTAAQAQKTSEGVTSPATSIESLDIPGGDAALPPIADSAIDVNSPFLQSLFRNGLGLRLINTIRYAQNTLQAFRLQFRRINSSMLVSTRSRVK